MDDVDEYMPAPREQRDPFEHARALFERSRDYVDRRIDALVEKFERHNKHRVDAIEIVGKSAANCERDLARGSSKPGWVQITFDQQREKIDDLESALGDEGWVRKAFNANAEAIAAQNRKLNAIFIAVALMLLGLLGNLVAIIVGAYQ